MCNSGIRYFIRLCFTKFYLQGRMVTMIIFLLLYAVEAVIIFIKWNDITDYHEIGKFGSKALGVHEHYNTITEKVIKWIIDYKALMWIPISLLAIGNFIAAWLISIIFSILAFIIHIFI